MPDTKKETVKLQVELNVDKEAYDSFVDFLTQWPDIFSTDYVGYWVRGYRTRDKAGTKVWLMHEFEECDQEASPEEVKFAIDQYKGGGGMPPNWYVLDANTAHKVVAAGVSRYGGNFCDNYDAESLDVAMQMAFLGEIRYG